MNKDKSVVLILAAGQGKRMQSDQPKQFLEIDGKPMLFYTIKAFEESCVDEIILVTAADFITYCENDIVKKFGFKKVKEIVRGGKERYDSVYNGLQVCTNTKYVLVHDGARPCITTECINKCLGFVKEKSSCIVGVKVKDTIKDVNEENVVVATPSRDRMWNIQTPQAFLYDELYKAYQLLQEKEDKNITDDAMVMESQLGKRIMVMEGEYTNIKVTTPEDLLIAEMFINQH